MIYEAVKEAQANQSNQNNVNVEPPISKERQARRARKELVNIKLHNRALRMEAYRGVRRPGRDYSGIFATLDRMIGTLAHKKEVIREVINEALRFKRAHLAQLLEEYMVDMEMNENRRQRNAVCLQCAVIRITPFCNACKIRKLG